MFKDAFKKYKNLQNFNELNHQPFIIFKKFELFFSTN